MRSQPSACATISSASSRGEASPRAAKSSAVHASTRRIVHASATARGIAWARANLRALLAASSLESQSLIGPYRVERVLARGGSAVVHAAIDERDGGAVAIKVPLESFGTARLGWFRRE